MGEKKIKKRQRSGGGAEVSSKEEVPKKVKISEQQQQQSNSQKGTQKVPNSPVKEVTKAIKPIIAKSSILIVRNACKDVKFSEKPFFKVKDSKTTQIICNFLDDKKNVIEALKVKLIGHYTYTEPAEKPLSLVLKGFYDVEAAELLQILLENKVPALKASVLFKNDNHSMYLVSFKSTTNLNVINHSHRVIDDVMVKWEPVKNKNRTPLQCHRCQRWGHSSSNCGFAYRCIKCTDDHPIGHCSRTSREGNPKCCNCRGDHAANHRGCDAYKAFERKVDSQKKVKVQTKRSVQHRIQDEDFPTLGISSLSQPITFQQNSAKTPTFSQQLKSRPQVSASNSSESQSDIANLTILTGQLLKIPNIQNTLSLLNTLIDQIKNISDDRERVLHIMQFCGKISEPNNGL